MQYPHQPGRGVPEFLGAALRYVVAPPDVPFGRLEQVPGPLPVQADGDRYLLQLVAADDSEAWGTPGDVPGVQLLLQELAHPAQVLVLFVPLHVPSPLSHRTASRRTPAWAPPALLRPPESLRRPR